MGLVWCSIRISGFVVTSIKWERHILQREIFRNLGVPEPVEGSEGATEGKNWMRTVGVKYLAWRTESNLEQTSAGNWIYEIFI